ncbi:uncharacterized protein METZ01_LOCUS318115, partial [marine metagenome]
VGCNITRRMAKKVFPVFPRNAHCSKSGGKGMPEIMYSEVLPFPPYIS